MYINFGAGIGTRPCESNYYYGMFSREYMLHSEQNNLSHVTSSIGTRCEYQLALSTSGKVGETVSHGHAGFRRAFMG